MRHIAAGLLFLAVGSVPALPFPALAQPSEVAYQGELKEHGSRFSGPAQMKFAIVKGCPNACQSLWSNDSTSIGGAEPNGAVDVTVIDGLFSVYLGASPMTPLRPQALADAVGAVLRVWVKTPDVTSFEQLTDQRLASVPFALRSESAGPATGGWTETGGNVYRLNGNVGIGTATPSERFEVANNDGILFRVTTDGITRSNGDFEVRNGRGDVTALIVHGDAGNVGIGTATPTNRFEVANDGGILFRVTTDGITRSNGDFEVRNGRGDVTALIVHGDAGNVGIGTSNPGATLDVAGTARAQVVEITGADIAERFLMSEKAEPGTVLEIDPDCAGRLRVCREAMSRSVAGVVSGAGDLRAGVVLASAVDSTGAPVALSGRVWVKTDAADRPVAVGDLLVSANRPGYASAAKNPTKAAGRILGKAMSSLERGTGLVLLFVSLQ